MGSSLRRLRIYYINNCNRTKVSIVIAICLTGVYLMWKLMTGSSSSYGIVRYLNNNPKFPMDNKDISAHMNAMRDTRPPLCHHQPYDFTTFDDPISILMEFSGNEFFNLKLTLTSVVENTPFDLYSEIIIIDDSTEDDEVRKHAAAFLKDSKFSKVSLFRADKKDGQAASRYKASHIASGKYLVFVSSSVIVNEGWLQPLIASVMQNPQMIAVPHHDNMLSDNRFHRTDDGLVNVFTWTVSTVFLQPSSYKSGSSELINSPVMRGDVFVVQKSYFDQLGNYDDRIISSTGANIELSLRAWLCGGSVKVALCSRVAVHSSLKPQVTKDDASKRRIVELWFDDYKDVAYKQNKLQPASSVSEKNSLRERSVYIKSHLGLSECKSLTWYLTNIAPEVVVPSEDMVFLGKLKTNTNFCLREETPASNVVTMVLCQQFLYDEAMIFEMNSRGAIFKGDQCLGVDENGLVTLLVCSPDKSSQTWKLNKSRLYTLKFPQKCLSQISKRDENDNLIYYAQLKDCFSVEERFRTWEFLSY